MDEYDPEEWAERVAMFADPGGRSALRRASRRNPRDRACPECGRKRVLTREDEAHGYVCDACADLRELGGP